jgi:hypothetical protein
MVLGLAIGYLMKSARIGLLLGLAIGLLAVGLRKK